MRALHRPAVLLLALASAACAANPRFGAERVAEADVVPGHVYELEQVTEKPRPINMREVGSMLERAYPSDLRDAGIEGRSRVWLVIDEGGQVVEATAVPGQGPLAFDRAALSVVRELRFRPARIGATVVRVRMELPIEWTILREATSRPQPPLTPRAP